MRKKTERGNGNIEIRQSHSSTTSFQKFIMQGAGYSMTIRCFFLSSFFIPAACVSVFLKL